MSKFLIHVKEFKGNLNKDVDKGLQNSGIHNHLMSIVVNWQFAWILAFLKSLSAFAG